jgi:3'(2'), 5'-bisphosphate nucleotidase
VQLKEDKSPLTLADLQSNAIIDQYLAKSKYPILSEENKLVEYEVRSHWNTFWMVDPLDGTKEFITRNGEFSINIALITNGLPVIGLLFVPVKQSAYFALKGHGSYFLENGHVQIESYNELISISKSIKYNVGANQVLRIGTSRSHLSQQTLALVESLRKSGLQTELIPSGSALKFGLFAQSELDFYPRLSPTMEWDTAAGQVIAEEAGGEVITWPEGKILTYNKINLTNPQFIVQPIGFSYL